MLIVKSSFNVSYVPPLLKKYCPKILNTVDCIQPALDLVKECFDDTDDKISLENIPKVMKSILGFLCENDGKNVVGKSS